MAEETKRGARRQQTGAAGLWLPAGLLAFAFSVVVVNQLRVQWFGRGAILDKAKSVRRLWAEDVIRADRGNIYAADGRLLAASADLHVLGINGESESLPDNPAFWSELGAAAGVSGAELRDYAARKGAANDFDIMLTREQARRVEVIRSKYDVKGVWTKSVESREYPLGKYCAPIIGYVDADGNGHIGLELSQEEILKGTPGASKGVTDDAGHFLPWLTQEESKAVAGKDIVLTIEPDLQVAVSNALQSSCELHDATRGTAIVLDPRTGDVMALATWPTFDPNHIDEARRDADRDSRSSPGLDPATELVFEPGSTFKAFTVALGLDTGTITTASTVQCTGTKVFSKTPMSCAGDHGGHVHGTVDPAKCIKVSCNLAAATWAVKVGFDRFCAMTKDLGLFEPQRIGLTGERAADKLSADVNKVVQTANLGFGQAIAVTPIGLASAFTVFANDGVRVVPRLIKSIDGKEQPVRVGKRVFSAETSREVLHMMKAVIESPGGTGTAMRISGVDLAGKTGTAQKLGSSLLPGKQYVSNFVGYVPAENPRALVLVMIDEPQRGGYYGGVVAGPVFRDTALVLMRKFRTSPSAGGAVAPH